MTDIKIDLALLNDLESKLTTITGQFRNAEEISHTIAGLVGHGGLEGTVRDFASKWNIHREKITDKLTFVLDATTAVHDTFVELDRRLTVQ
ncbi:MAG: hypothetical protein JWO10_270, partial [Microbacteriaceae bacterium]|nr:hypothetical protein [Microbacteriaceae bacterium]